MFDISRSSTRRSLRFLAVLGLAATLSGLALHTASAQEAEDLIINTDGTGISIAPQTPDVPVEALFNRTLLPNPGFPDFPSGFPPAPLVNDTGFDVFPGLDFESASGVPYDLDGNGSSDFPFSQLTIQQVGISDGLYRVYQYDGVTPVFGTDTPTIDFLGEWTLSENQLNPLQINADNVPLYFHQHFDFYATAPGVYTFDFRLINILLRDGRTRIPDSDTFRITYAVAAAVPEPGAVALLVGLAVAGIGFALRRRK
jgi:hypothetical protein